MKEIYQEFIKGMKPVCALITQKVGGKDKVKILLAVVAILLVGSIVLCSTMCTWSCRSFDKTDDDATKPQGNVTVTDGNIEDETDEDTTEDVPSIPVTELTIGQTLTTDFVEMTFTDVKIAADIKYSVTIDRVTRTTGPDPIEGQKYICLTGKMKNISTSALPVYDFFVGNFNIDGYNYEVTANDCDVLSGNGSSESSMDPLMEYVFRIYVAIPNSLADNHTSCTFTFGFYDMFDNEELSRNKAFADDPVAECPYQFKIVIK